MEQLEAIVTSIIDDTAILQIKDTGQEIAWPLSPFKISVAIGDSFIIQLKPTPVQTINRIVTTAKNSHRETNAQNDDVMQKMLESLIN